MRDNFPIIFLTGRPAAGKSEVIDYLKKTPLGERSDSFRVGDFIEVDDFPMLWTWFEEDALLQRMGKPRLHTDAEGYFSESWLWDLLIQRIELDYNKLLDDGRFDGGRTAILEFSRGAEHGGWQRAFPNFSDELLSKGAILYIDVSWEESFRKNRRRFNPAKPHSILEHGLPDDKMETLYRHSDWDDFAGGKSGYAEVRGVKIPYVSLDNSGDLTTAGGEKLGLGLRDCFKTLWELHKAR